MGIHNTYMTNIQMTKEYNTLLQEKEKAEILLLQSTQSIHQYEETVQRLIDYQNSTRLLSGASTSHSSYNGVKIKELIVQVYKHIHTYSCIYAIHPITYVYYTLNIHILFVYP